MIFRRFFAILIDIIIIAFIAKILVISFFSIINVEFNIINFWYSLMADWLYWTYTLIVLWPFSLILFIVGSFYFSYFESLKMQGTPGKKILGIKIVNTYGDDALDATTALFRFIAYVLINITIIGYIISIFMMIFREDGKMLHDIFLNTKVVRR